MKTVTLEVFYLFPENWSICSSCEMMMARANPEKPPFDPQLEQFPPEWKEEVQRLSDLILNLAEKYGERLQIQLWDPRSIPGLFKSIRYKVFRYPTFIVNRSERIAGWDIERLEQVLKSAISIKLGKQVPS